MTLSQLTAARAMRGDGLVPILVVLAVLAGAPQALAKSQVASSGGVIAAVSYVESSGIPSVRKVRISISKDGRVMRDEPITCPRGWARHCDPAPSTANASGRGNAVVVRNLDGDPEPEVLADFWTGGATCCAVSLLYDFVSPQAGYARRTKLWGGQAYEPVDLDGDNIPELATRDYRFDYVFAAKVASYPPLQIWSYEAAGFVDVTGRFPHLVARHVRGLWRIYLKERSRGEVEAVLASYIAEKYLLGQGRQGWRRARSAGKAGYLGGHRAAERYFRKLRRFLERTGYVTR